MAALINLSDHVLRASLGEEPVSAWQTTFWVKDAHIERVSKEWDDVNPILRALRQPLFRDVDSWSQLEMAHFHALLTLQLALLEDTNTRDATYDFFRDTLAALVHELDVRLDGNVGSLTITRITPDEVEIALSASLHSMELPPYQGLRVIVDNS